MLIHLLALLALSSSHCAIAMDPAEPKPKRCTYELWELSEHTLRLHIPKKIVLFDLEEPITDELLLGLNPAWRVLKNSSYAVKNEIMGVALTYFHYPDGYRIKRCLIALAACIGGNINYRTQSDSSAGKVAFTKQDFQLAKYVLEKGSFLHNEIGIEDSSLEDAKTTQLAALLIMHGAQIPKNMLIYCCRYENPASLMQFYLDQGAKPNLDLADTATLPLHHLVSGTSEENQIKKAAILLRAGLDIMYKDLEGNTALHKAAQARKNGYVTPWCEWLINTYLAQHRALLIFLGCIKKKHSNFYMYKDVRRFCFQESLNAETANLASHYK